MGSNDNNFNINTNNNLNNNNAGRGIALAGGQDLFSQFCSCDNLYKAYRKARKGKTKKEYVKEFEKQLKSNIQLLRQELITQTYVPRPLKTFILRDPKTRKISKSDFRDRVIHHAICNIIEPIFEKSFIYDSYANRKGKGTLKAIERFDYFKRKVSRNHTKIKSTNSIKGFVLKADIKKFFDNVSHKILIRIIRKKINDENVIKLVETILSNHKTETKGKGMPLGNLTSQFFANVYLNELDKFVKHKLRAKYYIRYVDDFVIMNKSRETLTKYEEEIEDFMRNKLDLESNRDKTQAFPLYKGTKFLGLRIYAKHRLLNKRNIRKFNNKLIRLTIEYDEKKTSYDTIYDFLEGWLAYCKIANTYELRKRKLELIEEKFIGEISNKEIDGMISQNHLFSI